MKSYLRISLIVSGLIVFGASLVYVLNFRFSYISDKPENWAQLGDFLNVFVSLASLILLSTLTYYIYKKEEEREKKFNKPLLVFQFNDNGQWKVRNVGNSVLLNIYLRVTRENKGLIRSQIKIVSMKAGEEIELFFVRNVTKWEATFSNLQGDVSSFVYSDDTYQLLEGIKYLPCEKEKYLFIHDAKNLGELYNL